MKLYVGLLGAIAALLLSACSPKPPECASPEAMKLANEIFVDNIRKQLQTGFAVGAPQFMAEIAPFIAALKFETSQVVSNGYNSDAKKQSCKARFTMTNTTSYKALASPLPVFDQMKNAIREHHVDSEYSLQMTTDKSGQFVMEIQGAGDIVQTAIAWFPLHVGLKEGEKVSAPTLQPQAATPVSTPQAAPRFEVGDEYASVRSRLLALGWTPFRAADADACSQSDARCAGRPEMQSCSGSGRAPCKFLWKAGSDLYEVITVDEDARFFSMTKLN